MHMLAWFTLRSLLYKFPADEDREIAFENMLPLRSWILIVACAALAFKLIWQLFVYLWLTPLRMKQAFQAQGIKGMPYRFFYGNAPEFLALDLQARKSPMREISHNIAPRLLPAYFEWSQKLGKPFFFWFGSQVRVFVTEPEQAREVLANKFGHYRKPDGRPDVNDLFGKGLASVEGEKWAQHRRILNPAFYVEKLKAMTPAMAACVGSLLNDWVAEIEHESSGCKEIDVHKEMRNLTADIISHTAFGSSYAEGKRVFEIQHEQQIILSKLMRSVYIPGSRFLPTSMNRYRWKLEAQIQKLLRGMIYSRLGSTKAVGANLLELLLAANKSELQGNQKNLSMEIGEIVDECKTFFFAGHETTSTLLTWTLMLLGKHQEWQERARQEVLGVYGRADAPTADSVNNLKIVGMVLNEALRLYPPAAALVREASKEMKLGENLVLPKGTVVMLPIIAFHHEAKYWGADVHQFNPQRFADGIAKAGINPTAFMPFGLGPRNCIGQNFALLEAKIALSLILQRFTFHISPTYTHAPTSVLTVQPQYGMPIIFQKLVA